MKEPIDFTKPDAIQRLLERLEADPSVENIDAARRLLRDYGYRPTDPEALARMAKLRALAIAKGIIKE
jgi:hypothetical protein